jgi:hypothetical protein
MAVATPSDLQLTTATAISVGMALVAVVWVVRLCLRERIVWPAIVLVGGAFTCLLEPLFDSLYDMRFSAEGHWHLFTTFGSPQPIWTPFAYMAFYGGATVIVARIVQRAPTMRTVWLMYAAILAMSFAAELSYINIFDAYAYLGRQPFLVLGYPLFMGFTNAMSALIGGLLIARLATRLRGWDQLALVAIVPMAFGAGLFGTGILYLSVRYSSDQSPMWLLSLAALTVPLAIAWTARLIGKVVIVGTDPRDLEPAEAPRPMAGVPDRSNA